MRMRQVEVETEAGESQVGRLPRSTRKLFEVMDMFIILSVVLDSQVHTYIKTQSIYFILFYFILFIWLCRVLVAAHRIFVAACGIFAAVCGIFAVACGIFSRGMRTLSYGMWDLVPQPGIKPRPPALGVWCLSHWTTREVLRAYTLNMLSILYVNHTST